MLSFDFKTGDVGKFAKQFKELNSTQQAAILTSKNFTEAQKNFLAKSAGVTLTTNGQVVATNTLSASQTTATATTNGLSVAFEGLWATMKPILISLATNPMTWVVAASALAVIIDSKLNPSLEKSKEKLEETQSKLSEVNSQIDENINKIKELESLDSLSITDEEDLKRLKAENKELEIRQAYLERLEELDKQQVVDSAKREYNQQYGSQSAGEKMSKGRQLSSDIAEYKHYQDKKNQAVVNEDGKALEKWNNKLAKTEEKLIESRQELQVFKDELMATGASSEELDSVNAQLKQIDELLMISTDSGEKLKEELEEVADTVNKIDEATLNKNVNESFDTIKKSYKAVQEFKKAMSEGMTESALNGVAELSDELKVMVAEFHSGTISADELYQALNDHYNVDLKNYADAIIAKNQYSEQFYNKVGLANAEFTNSMLENYGVDISNCKTYNEARLRIEQQTLNTLGKMWSKYYNAQTKSYTSEMASLGRQIEQRERAGQDASALRAIAQQVGAQARNYESAVAALDKVVYSGITSNFEGISNNISGGAGKSGSSQVFDWIEIAISRLQRTITNLGKTVSATWKSWTDRNSALKSQISAVTQEINLQANAANKYLSLANSVGLGEGYKSLVRNGTLDISTISDENTINAIKQYQEYYENYLSALDAKQDAEDELASLVREDFDMIAKQFDSEISLVEANISTLEAYIDQAEMKGNLVSKNYYSSMYAEEQKNLSLLQQKYDQLSNKLSNGTITKGSEEFNNMATEIKEVSKAIIESNTALEEYQKTMRELDWEVFDLIEEKIGNLVDESNDWIDLLSNSKLFNDDGSITSQGQATLGLHVANMKIYESQVKDYADELEKLDTQFANDSLDKNYLERRQELLELQRESILNAQLERQNIQDLWSDGYSKLLDYMQEVSDKYRDMISQISDTRDFEKSIKSQIEEISRLENIWRSYQNDTSEEGKMNKQQIGEQLKEARETLEETEREQYLKELDRMITAMMDDASEWQNARLDDVSGLIQDVIDGVDKNAGSIEETLKTEVSAVGGSLTAEMQNIFNGADGVKGVVGGVNDTLLDIKNLIQSMVKGSDTEASKNASGATTNVTPATTPASTPQSTHTPTPQPTEKAITVGGLINAGSATIYSNANGGGGGRQFYRANPIYTVLGEKNNFLKVRHSSLSSGTTGWFKKSDVKAYKTGGLVDYTGLAWVDGEKGKPEAFLNANDTELFAKLKDSLEIVSKTNMFDAIQSYAKMPNFISGASNKNITNHNTFEFILPHIKDADDFITDLQHSKRFENVILAITDGKGDLDKYKY